MTKQRRPESAMSMAVNGKMLEGVKIAGRWQLTCSWPEVAALSNGKTDCNAAIAEFIRRALANATTVTSRLARNGS